MQDADKMSGEDRVYRDYILSAELFCKPKIPLKKKQLFALKNNRTTPETQKFIQGSLKHYAAQSNPEKKEYMICDPFI